MTITLYSKHLQCLKVQNLVSSFLNYTSIVKYSNDEKNDGHKSEEKQEEKSKTTTTIKTLLEPPEEPTTCCMSGCPNCVWLDYAEALCKYYQDGGEKAIKEINERISDPNIKAYILHEIRMRTKK